VKEEKVFIPSAGIQLEGLLSIHETLSHKGGLILCHPHPLYGGNMHHHVVRTGAEVAQKEGFSTLRFNFRGVGESGGSYNGGIGEKEDVEAAISFLHSRLNDSAFLLLFLGYSFGAWAGLPVAIRDERIKGMVAISPPLKMFDFGYLRGCKKRKLFIAGSRDPWCPTSLLEEWYQGLEEPKSLSLIQGADHFFSFHVNLLIQPLQEFFNQF